MKTMTAVVLTTVAFIALSSPLIPAVTPSTDKTIRQLNYVKAPTDQLIEFANAIEFASTLCGVEKELIIALAHTESNFKEKAVSSKGAMGIMQLMPETAKEMGVEDPYDPTQNIIGGTRYLKTLMDKYRNKNTALLAYKGYPFGCKRGKSIVRHTLKLYTKLLEV